ncbi:MAG TPA: hypothetical protein VJM08_18645 [Anaerolineales bacterium]|nr:hypothetical protein [Anaerolineales bacterium]
MANNKTVGTILLVAGIILLLVSLGADAIGLGGGGRVGGQQILGAVVGVILLVAGFVYYRR